MILIPIILVLGVFYARSRNLDKFLYLFLFTLFYFPLLLNWTGAYQFQGYVPIALIAILFVLKYKILVHNNVFLLLMIRLMLVLISLLCLILISSLINNYDFLKGFLWFRNFFWGYIIFAMFISLQKPHIDIRRVFFFIFISQVVLVCLQYVGGTSFNEKFLLLEYEKDGAMKGATAEGVMESTIRVGGHLLVGSLGKITILSNFIAQFVTFWIGFSIVRNYKLKIIDVIVVLISFGVILSTGVRTPLLSGFIGVLLSVVFVHYSRRKAFRYLFLGVLFFVIALPPLIQMGTSAMEEKLNYGETVQRAVSIFGVLSNLSSSELVELDTSNTFTLGRSIYLLQFITYKTLLFGTGIYTKNPFGYGPGISSISDCMLVFVIVEFGIIALTLCFVPYKTALSLVKKRCSKDVYTAILVLFIVITLQTIVDPGIFDMLSSYCFYIICALLINTQGCDKSKSLNSTKKFLSRSSKTFF
jgi:hypothetical protein